MDYVAISPLADYYRDAQKLYSYREIKLVRRRNARTLHNYIDYLNRINDNNDGSTPLVKIDNIIIDTHSNAQGHLFFPIYSNRSSLHTFELLEDTLKVPIDPDKSVAVSDSILNIAVGVANYFHILGCNIGKALPVLSKLKEALGGRLVVTAPLHTSIFQIKRAYGAFEHMAYRFVMNATSPITNINQLRIMFNAQDFKYYNGDSILNEEWKKLIPRIRRNDVKTEYPTIGISLNRNTTIITKRKFTYRIKNSRLVFKFNNAADIPNSYDERYDYLTNNIHLLIERTGDTIGTFTPEHPFPRYQRMGAIDVYDYIGMQEWRFNKNGNKLICIGRYHQYSLGLTIIGREPDNLGNVIHNFYRKPGTTYTTHKGLVETDTNFFAIV